MPGEARLGAGNTDTQDWGAAEARGAGENGAKDRTPGPPRCMRRRETGRGGEHYHGRDTVRETGQTSSRATTGAAPGLTAPQETSDPGSAQVPGLRGDSRRERRWVLHGRHPVFLSARPSLPQGAARPPAIPTRGALSASVTVPRQALTVCSARLPRSPAQACAQRASAMCTHV